MIGDVELVAGHTGLACIGSGTWFKHLRYCTKACDLPLYGDGAGAANQWLPCGITPVPMAANVDTSGVARDGSRCQV